MNHQTIDTRWYRIIKDNKQMFGGDGSQFIAMCELGFLTNPIMGYVSELDIEPWSRTSNMWVNT